MTYRERRLRRAERLREWAKKRDAKSDAARERVDEIAGMIPFGQPILVGHHSEGRHRRDVKRIDNGMRQTVEHARKAESMRSRADNIEAAADHAIYSDDDDAIERLRERIADLEADRARIKAYNASCRKGPGDRSILTAKEQAKLASTEQVCAYQMGKNGAAPGYWLTNLGGNLNRQKKRLAQLEREAAR